MLASLSQAPTSICKSARLFSVTSPATRLKLTVPAAMRVDVKIGLMVGSFRYWMMPACTLSEYRVLHQHRL